MFFLWVGIRGCKLLLLTQRRTYRKHIELPPQYPNRFVHNAKRKVQRYTTVIKKRKKKNENKKSKTLSTIYDILFF